MKVVGTRILVKQSKTKEVTEGGIALPSTSQQKLPLGEVRQVGPGTDIVRVGQMVLFSGIGAIDMPLLPDHVLIEPDDILAVLEEGDLK